MQYPNGISWTYYNVPSTIENSGTNYIVEIYDSVGVLIDSNGISTTSASLSLSYVSNKFGLKVSDYKSVIRKNEFLGNIQADSEYSIPGYKIIAYRDFYATHGNNLQNKFGWNVIGNYQNSNSKSIFFLVGDVRISKHFYSNGMIISKRYHSIKYGVNFKPTSRDFSYDRTIVYLKIDVRIPIKCCIKYLCYPKKYKKA